MMKPSRKDVTSLLQDLCTQLGYSMAIREPERFIELVPQGPDSFANAVLLAEGLDPVLEKPGTRVAAEYELGYTFDSAVWGQGYASEAACAVFRYARKRLGIARIISIIHAENAASLGVARKFGLEREDAVWMSGRSFDRYRWP